MASCNCGFFHGFHAGKRDWPDQYGTIAYIGLCQWLYARLGRGDGMDALENNPHIRFMQDRERFLREIKLYYRAMGSMIFISSLLKTIRSCARNLDLTSIPM